MTPFARATTNANGGYTLHLPATERSLLLGPRSNVYMTMQIIAFYPDTMASWFMPLKPGNDPSAAGWDAAAGGAGAGQ